MFKIYERVVVKKGNPVFDFIAIFRLHVFTQNQILNILLLILQPCSFFGCGSYHVQILQLVYLYSGIQALILQMCQGRGGQCPPNYGYKIRGTGLPGEYARGLYIYIYVYIYIYLDIQIQYVDSQTKNLIAMYSGPTQFKKYPKT